MHMKFRNIQLHVDVIHLYINIFVHFFEYIYIYICKYKWFFRALNSKSMFVPNSATRLFSVLKKKKGEKKSLAKHELIIIHALNF